MAQFADQFAEARTTTSSFLTQKRFGFERNQQNNRQNNDRQYQPKDNVQATSTNQRRCFICGRFGHKANECDSRRPVRNQTDRFSDGGHGTEKSGNNNTRYRNQNTSTARQQTNNRNYEKFQGNQRHGNYRQGQGSSVIDKQIDLPHGSETVTFIETNMPIVKGCIGGRIINVLRDTGCSRAVIRRDLVEPDQMTGQNQKCILADERVVDADLAEVEVDTPYYTGTVIAWCFDNLSYDLILGNFNGVRNPDDPDTSWIRST